ncbi:MAG: hypothetical protein M3451_03620 [Chloroflexota bacterium]|nr:hypothetical protein [Chloroflexota bacterium]
MNVATTIPEGMRTTGSTNNIELKLANFEWFLDWLGHSYGGKSTIKLSPKAACHTRLFRGKRCPAGCPGACHYGRNHRCLSPEADHSGMWLVNGRAVAITSEPYWDFDDWSEGGILQVEQEWADAHGLELHVFDRGWWAAGVPLLVFTAAKPEHGWWPVLNRDQD